MKTKFKAMTLSAVCLGLAGCGGPDLGTRIAGSEIAGDGLAAEAQRISGAAILMKPQIEDVTENDFNIRYIEMGFGSGTPASVRDLAIKQCAEFDKEAVFKAASRGLFQLNTVKAYYQCV